MTTSESEDAAAKRCSCPHLDRFQACIQRSEWNGAADLVDHMDDCWNRLKQVMDKALADQHWNLVLQMIERGVPGHLRNNILQSALGHRHVQCAARLIDLGVSKHCREEGIRQQIAAGHGDFVLKLVRNVGDTDLTDFVLRESLNRSQWSLVSGLVKEGLSVAQMESVCDQAVADQQWTVALQLLRDGVSASEWMVNELFQNNKAQDLLDLSPAGNIPEGLKGLLLMASIRHGLGDLTQHILQTESFSDSELMEAMTYAIHLQDKPVFLQLFRYSPRNRRVFKQKFFHQPWKESHQSVKCDGGEVKWIFDVLFEEGEKDLALLVATSGKTFYPLTADYCWGEREQVDLKPKKMSLALTKLLELNCKKYRTLVKKMYSAPETSQSTRSCLFRHTIQQEEYQLTHDLCKFPGETRNDLKFAFSWLVLGGLNAELFSSLFWVLDSKTGRWLSRYAVKRSMREYFKTRSDSNLEIFIDQLANCCQERFACRIFRNAVRKCVELDCADCFGMLCKTHLTPEQHTDRDTLRGESFFAYTSAVDANLPHFISKVCEEHFSSISEYDLFLLGEMELLIGIIMKKEAWHLLVSLSAGLKSMQFYSSDAELMEKCLHKMLTDPSVLSDIAAGLDLWIRHWKTRDDIRMQLTNMKAKIAAGQWVVSMSIVKQWCVDHDLVNLAFFMALLTDDWELFETVATSSSLQPDPSVVLEVPDLAAEQGKLSAAVAVMKFWPVTRDNVYYLYNSCKQLVRRRQPLAAICEEQGLLSWALVLMVSFSEYILAKHFLCQDPPVLNFLLRSAVKWRRWDVAEVLVPRCTESEVLARALEKAVLHGQRPLAEQLICRVDPNAFYSDDFEMHLNHDEVQLFEEDYFREYDNLLSVALESSRQVRVDMVKFCISAGLSTFHCPLREALGKPDPRVVKLLLASGALSHQRLCSFRPENQGGVLHMAERRKQVLLQGYSYVAEAAATPCRLDHLARLVVSHRIGLRPGRPDRINSLPIPEPCKDLLNFKDVISMDVGEL